MILNSFYILLFQHNRRMPTKVAITHYLKWHLMKMTIATFDVSKLLQNPLLGPYTEWIEKCSYSLKHFQTLYMWCLLMNYNQ